MKAAERGVGAPPPGLTHGNGETHAEGCGHSTQAISLFHMIIALCGSRARRHRRCGCRAMSDIIDMKAQRKKRRPSVGAEQALRRALARGSALRCLSLKHEVALFIWRAAAVADSDPDKGADFLEMAAQRLRRKEVEEPTPASARD
jgi:hypothetical protein